MTASLYQSGSLADPVRLMRSVPTTAPCHAITKPQCEYHVGTLRTLVAIVGSGFGGLGAAIRLKRDGVEDFLILELELLPTSVLFQSRRLHHRPARQR